MRLLYLSTFYILCSFSCFLYSSLSIPSSDLLVFLQTLPSLQDIETGKEKLELLLKKAEEEEQRWNQILDSLDYHYFVDANIHFHQNLIEHQTSSGLFDKVMSPALLKLRKEAKKFLDKAPKARITLFLQELCSTCFSSEEKTTFAYFQQLQALIPDEGSHFFESSLIEYLHESAYLTDEENDSIMEEYGKEENFSYEELKFIVRFAKLQLLRQLFEEKKADKKYCAHLKNYESILKKEFILTHNFQILKDFCDGKILVSSDLEQLAIKPIRKYLKPFQFEEKDFLNLR